MRINPAIIMLLGLVASPLAAQDRYGIPPGQLPPPGQCRVWFDNRPAGRQPRPTSCREAELTAARSPNARVIYGARRDNGQWSQNDRYPYPSRNPNGGAGYGFGSVPFNNGYKDGFDKGREDARDRDSYDPVRHDRYRDGDHGYNKRYGTKDQYKNVYRDGFRGGYDDGYREVRGYGSRQATDRRSPWPY
jgi:hypothetical protein